MAHATPPPRRPRAALAAAAAIAWAGSAGGAVLGEIEVRSALGEALEARIAVAPSAGEVLEASCFLLARGPRAEGPFVTRARIALEETAGARFLTLQSLAPVNDAVVKLRVIVACPGRPGMTVREYPLLLDPRSGAIAPAAPRAAASPPVQPLRAAPAGDRPRVPGLAALEGDTLESLATAIFPRNRKARAVYIEALREDNPALAGLGDRDPITPGTSVVLPDLRTFARGRPVMEETAPAATSAALAQPVPAAAPRIPPPAKRDAPAPAKREAPAPAKREAPAEAPKPAAPRPRAARSADAAFVLKLSAPEVDLARSRGVDDRLRAQLRERLLVLDADDQVAALLSLRNSLKQLEGRVAELQLKLAGMPASLQGSPPPRHEPERQSPAADARPMAAVPVVPAAPAALPMTEPTRPEAKAPSPPKGETRSAGPAAKPEPVAPAAQATLAPAIAKPDPKPAVPPPAEEKKPPIVKPLPEPPQPAAGTDLPTWLWAVVALLAATAAAIGWRTWRNRAEPAGPEGGQHPEPDSAVLPASDSPAAQGAFDELEIAAQLPEPRAPPPPAAERRVMSSDAGLATSVSTGDPRDLRRRYLEQRFPEIANRTIALENADSVVKGARLLYEDGALPRAVELLQFAIEEKPSEVKTWLALFEIFRLEGLAGEFAELAGRFREHHGQGDYWHKVQYFGREIDPANALYREPGFDSLETIGFPASKRLPGAPAFDPHAENWLNAPMDFTDEVLANELRQSLLAEAGLTERDLIPNPMPALRNIEMFTVA